MAKHALLFLGRSGRNKSGQGGRGWTYTKRGTSEISSLLPPPRGSSMSSFMRMNWKPPSRGSPKSRNLQAGQNPKLPSSPQPTQARALTGISRMAEFVSPTSGQQSGAGLGRSACTERVGTRSLKAYTDSRSRVRHAGAGVALFIKRMPKEPAVGERKAGCVPEKGVRG